VNFAEVNGTALRYDLLGSGAATLVLIHEMGGTIESWDLVAPMLSTKRRVLRYDTRGAGLSQKIRPPLAIDSMVDDLVALLDELGIAGKVALAGIAVGGAIALHTAALCPQRVAAFRARWLGGDPISYGAIYRMLAGMDLAPELPRIACPVLVIAGTLDRTRPPLLVEPVARAISGARYVVLETGHYAPIQTPELYVRTVDEFLDAIRA
jgi:3-oxoadipate enol-lactonase